MARHRKKSGSKNTWADHLTQKAQAENYPARSVYKLMEIQRKFKIMAPGNTVVDAGCAPGSWLLFAAEQVGKQGKVWGIDLQEVSIALPDHVQVIQGDLRTLDNPVFMKHITGCHVILSDMAPATTGRKDVDALRSLALCETALELAREYLGDGGNFVCKIFQGSQWTDFEKQVRAMFASCSIFKPESCRKQSREIYIVAKNKR